MKPKRARKLLRELNRAQRRAVARGSWLYADGSGNQYRLKADGQPIETPGDALYSPRGTIAWVEVRGHLRSAANWHRYR